MKYLQRIVLLFVLLAVVLALLVWQWPLVRSAIGTLNTDTTTWIQRVAAITAIILFLAGVVARLLRWALGTSKQLVRDRDLQLLHAVTPDELRARLGRGGQVNWIDRHAVAPADLHHHRRVVIIGRMKLGKTREAIELIRASALDLVPSNQVFEPGPAFRLCARDSLPAMLRTQLQPQVPALLFLDELPWNFYGEGLERLAISLNTLDHESDGAYVVATARSEYLTPDHRDWLAAQRFYPVALSDLDADQIGRLVDNAAGIFQLEVGDAARAAFVDSRDGTPELVISSMRLMEAGSRVDPDAVAQYARDGLKALWGDLRFKLNSRYPLAAHLFDSLATFHAARVTPYASLVLHYAAYLRRGRRHWGLPLRPRPALRRALAALAPLDIAVRDKRIHFPDVSVESMMAPHAAEQQLSAFLEGHRRLFHRPWLRRLYSDALMHQQALSRLSSRAAERQEWEDADRLCDLAASVLPEGCLYCALGAYHAVHNNMPQAIASYSQAIALDPKLGSAYVNRGRVHHIVGDLAEAIADYSQAIAITPSVDLYLDRGTAYADQGDLAGAIADYTQAIALAPKYDASYLLRGGAWAAQGELARAIADYTQAIALDPRRAVTYNDRGCTYAAQSDLLRAIADHTKAIALDPRFAAPYVNRGVAYAEQGELAKAMADLTQAIACDPEFAAAYAMRGKLHDIQGDLSLAIADYTQAIALGSRSDSASYYRRTLTSIGHCQLQTIGPAPRIAFGPEFRLATAYHSRGAAYAKQGNVAEAITDFTQAIALDPQDAKAYVHRGYTYGRQGDNAHAIADYTQAITLDPQGAEGYVRRGRVYDDQGDHIRAIADYTQAIALDPNNACSYCQRAYSYYRQGDMAEAIAGLSRAILLGPDCSTVPGSEEAGHPYLVRGAAWAAQGELDQASADFAQVIALDPQDARAYIHRGAVYDRQGDCAHAIADYTQAITLDPTDANAYLRRGHALYKQGDLAQAVADYGRAIELDPRNAYSYYDRACVYYKQGQLQLALADLARAREVPMEPADRQASEDEWTQLQPDPSAPPPVTPSTPAGENRL